MEEVKQTSDDDHYIYCDKCEQRIHAHKCKELIFKVVVDKVPRKRCGTKYAMQTLPANLCVKLSLILNAGKGVFTTKRIQVNTRFGPYTGVKIDFNALDHDGLDSSHMWEIVQGGETTHVIDGIDPAKSNWLRYVNCARSEDEQNLIAFQYRGDIFYRVYKEIEPGGELLVWYGDEYGEALGIPILPHQVNESENRSEIGEGDATLLVPNQVIKNEHEDGGISIPPNQINTNYENTKENEDSPKESDYICIHCGRMYNYKSFLEAHLKRCPMLVSYESWPCNICGRKYSNEDYLHVHQKKCGLNPENHRVNISVKVTQCQYCDKIFTSRASAIIHERIHTGECSYECSQCGKSFAQQANLKCHERIHSGERPYKCPQCGKTFKRQDHLRRHERIHSGERPYKCPQCRKTFKRQDHLRRHEWMHSGERPHECPHCGKTFAQLAKLTKHVQLHSGERPYECPQCEKIFAQRAQLTLHKQIHSHERPYKCPLCGKSFKQQAHLRCHERMHSGERPHECAQCGKTFAQQATLKYHERIHSDERPYKCPQCGKTFKRQDHLRCHERMHSSERPHECPHCGKTFAQLTSLTNHVRIHSGERPYQCPQCGKSFKRQDHLRRHEQIHSGERP